MPSFSSWVGAFASFIPGFRLIDGGDLQTLVNAEFSTKAKLTALAGGGQTGATPLPASYNEVDTAGAGGTDSVMLPLALPGANISIYNQTSNSIQVFGQPANPQNGGAGDTIAAHNSGAQQATATGVSQGGTVVASYICFQLGQWKQSITA